MIVTLLPFFLVANITGNPSDWKYGAEVMYNATIDVSSRPLDPSENTVTIKTFMRLKCRSKSEVMLTCRLDNPRLVLTLEKPRGNSMTKDVTENDRSGGDVFELKFSDIGLEEIIVPSSIIPSKVEMIRALIGQLNFGTDLTAHTINYYQVKDKSSVGGECKTNYLMWLSAAAVEQNGAKEDTIEPTQQLIILPSSKTFFSRIEEMQRTRHVDDCRYPVNNFFGNWEKRRVSPAIEMQLKSSLSHMNVTTRGLTCFTEINLLLNGHDNSTIATLTERLTVSLDKIVPANGPLAKIRNPLAVGIAPMRWLHSDDSEESQVDENR